MRTRRARDQLPVALHQVVDPYLRIDGLAAKREARFVFSRRKTGLADAVAVRDRLGQDDDIANYRLSPGREGKLRPALVPPSRGIFVVGRGKQIVSTPG